MERRFYLVDAQVLPEVFLKVVRAKELLASGEARSISAATRAVELSRSAFYKYKDCIFDSENGREVITVMATLRDETGALQSLLAGISAAGASIVTINQSTPENGAALVAVTIRTDTMQMTPEELTEKLAREFLRNKIRYESMSVYGSLRPRIFVRGFDVRDLTYGAKDIREMSEKVLGIGLSDPEMSIDYDKLNMFMECRKRFAMKHGQYSERAHRLEANGDVAVSFKGDDESFYMLVCDGMGSGREAALTAQA